MAKAASFVKDVKHYDASTEEAHIQKLVNYGGIALQNRDSSLAYFL